MIPERWVVSWSTWDMMVQSEDHATEFAAFERYCNLLREGLVQRQIRAIHVFGKAECKELFSTWFPKKNS